MVGAEEHDTEEVEVDLISVDVARCYADLRQRGGIRRRLLHGAADQRLGNEFNSGGDFESAAAGASWGGGLTAWGRIRGGSAWGRKRRPEDESAATAPRNSRAKAEVIAESLPVS